MFCNTVGNSLLACVNSHSYSDIRICILTHIQLQKHIIIFIFAQSLHAHPIFKAFLHSYKLYKVVSDFYYIIPPT